MKLSPSDILPAGTSVQTTGGSKRVLRGTVVKHEIAPNGAVVHTCKMTEKRGIPLGWNNGVRWVKLNKPVIWRGNYSFLETRDNQLESEPKQK